MTVIKYNYDILSSCRGIMNHVVMQVITSINRFIYKIPTFIYIYIPAINISRMVPIKCLFTILGPMFHYFDIW